MTRVRAAPLARAALGVVLALPPAAAQGRASERGLVAQTVAGTTITVEYYRPVARGRDSLFGKVVRWGETWTPGANWATTLEADKDIRLNGHPLPKGKYSVWMIPRRDSAWTVILSRDARRFHTRRPAETDEQLRFTAKPEQGPHMEALAWYFPVVTPNGAALRMHWGTTMVPLAVGVESPPPPTLAAAERATYVGTYRMTPSDAEATGPRQYELEVVEAEGKLRAIRKPSLPDVPALELIPAGRHRFLLGVSEKGQLFVEPEWSLVFHVSGSHATGVEMHGVDDRLMARGELVK